MSLTGWESKRVREMRLFQATEFIGLAVCYFFLQYDCYSLQFPSTIYFSTHSQRVPSSNFSVVKSTAYRKPPCFATTARLQRLHTAEEMCDIGKRDIRACSWAPLEPQTAIINVLVYYSGRLRRALRFPFTPFSTLRWKNTKEMTRQGFSTDSPDIAAKTFLLVSKLD